MITNIYRKNNSNIISKISYKSFHEIENKFPDYMTNLSYSNVHELIKFMVNDGNTTDTDLLLYLALNWFEKSKIEEISFEDLMEKYKSNINYTKLNFY